MIQFIAAAAVGVGLYAAAKAVSREMRRVSDFLDNGDRSDRPPVKVMRLQRDESTGHYKPVPAEEHSPDAGVNR